MKQPIQEYKMLNAFELILELRQQWVTLASFTVPRLQEQTVHYLRLGAAKRLRWIAKDLEWLLNSCPDNRDRPLAQQECEDAGIHLNSLYLHIRGTLDNFSWALLWHIASDQAEKIEREKREYMKVGLFTPILKRHLQSKAPDLADVIEQSRSWDLELKSKRDPVAHRLPLRVIPQVLSYEQTQQYEELHAKALETIAEFLENLQKEKKNRVGDTSIEGITAHCQAIETLGLEQKERQQSFYRRMSELGTFMPLFASSGVFVPVYPTILEDCQQLAAITKEVISFFKSQS